MCGKIEKLSIFTESRSLYDIKKAIENGTRPRFVDVMQEFKSDILLVDVDDEDEPQEVKDFELLEKVNEEYIAILKRLVDTTLKLLVAGNCYKNAKDDLVYLLEYECDGYDAIESAGFEKRSAAFLVLTEDVPQAVTQTVFIDAYADMFKDICYNLMEIVKDN